MGNKRNQREMARRPRHQKPNRQPPRNRAKTSTTTSRSSRQTPSELSDGIEERKPKMANIDLTQWSEKTISAAANPEQGYINIIIGSDDLFINIEQAYAIHAALGKAVAEYEGEAQ